MEVTILNSFNVSNVDQEDLYPEFYYRMEIFERICIYLNQYYLYEDANTNIHVGFHTVYWRAKQCEKMKC